MLKSFFTMTLFLLSLEVFACWKVEGSLAVDGETWRFNQKFDHGKDYALPLGNYILRLALKKEEKGHEIKYFLEEKKENKLVLITKGEDEVEENKSHDIYAKGEPDQPNSIITIKISPL